MMEIRMLQIAGMCVNVSLLTESKARPRTFTSQAMAVGLEFANIEDVEVYLSGWLDRLR